MNGNLIYEPKGKAREYAALSCNLYRGCDHACTYCYAPSATRRTTADFCQPATRGADFLYRLTREARAHQKAGVTGQILLCFTCDPYQTLDVTERVTRAAIPILHDHGFSVCALTKGGSRSLRDIDLFGPTDAFATTLTLDDAQQSAEWEPGAASPDDRIATIAAFHAAGIPTWVSFEPVIDPDAALRMIERTAPIVDLYKVGKLNYHARAKEIDWYAFAHDAVALLESLGKDYYIKEDLRPYLSSRA